MYTHTHVYTHVLQTCMCAHTYACVYTCMHAHVYIYIYNVYIIHIMCIYIQIYMYVYIALYVCVCVCVCVCIKNPSANAGDMGLIPGSGRSPGEGHATHPSIPAWEKSHGQRSPMGHSPRGHQRVRHDLAAKQQGVFVCVCSAAHSCPTLCDAVDCSPPGSSVHGILWARPLEWVAIFYSKTATYNG